MLYNQKCGFYGCELNHKEDEHILNAISGRGNNPCCDHGRSWQNSLPPDNTFDESRIGTCGPTEYGDTCACGCDATGWRCGIIGGGRGN